MFISSKNSIRLAFILATVSVSACARSPFPITSDPYAVSTSTTGLTDPASFRSTVVADTQETSNILALTAQSMPNTTNRTARNDFITLKMYMIDRLYFDYERRLSNEDTAINSLGSIGTLASTAVAAAIPAGQATKVLSAVALGLTSTTSLYDQKVLLTQTIQALLIEMRTDRSNQAAVIYTRMTCRNYPLGLIYSDLETYARVGTFEAALQGLSKTVNQAHDVAQDAKNAAAGGNAALSNATQTLVDAALASPAMVPKVSSCPLDAM